MKTYFLIIFTFLFACTGTKETVQTSQIPLEQNESKKQEKPRFDEKFDPLTLNDDGWVIHKKASAIKDQIGTITDKASDRTGYEKSTKEQTVFGFRVQLYSTTDYYLALGVRDEAGVKLKDDIYVDYEQPYYKVRAGNFTEREKAEEIKNFAKSLGYPDAWVIQTNVLLKEK